MNLLARAFPFLENPAPHGAEDDDARQMEGSAGETEFAHLGLAHGVEEKLEIPAGAGQRVKIRVQMCSDHVHAVFIIMSGELGRKRN